MWINWLPDIGIIQNTATLQTIQQKGCKHTALIRKSGDNMICHKAMKSSQEIFNIRKQCKEKSTNKIKLSIIKTMWAICYLNKYLLFQIQNNDTNLVAETVADTKLPRHEKTRFFVSKRAFYCMIWGLGRLSIILLSLSFLSFNILYIKDIYFFQVKWKQRI